ncbi:MAG: tRNA (adenosine(37)-N6)-threonylcarbamoyltransferase complex ATPase subunit type 1 TsaE [Zetaproteobacteria bacterium CG2_30_46_52]|nr:MAG: tRNA (adenosine(37)-N6)-threonylcarbamoyltransferase complex ATPase subunit type 1 TsaE [Zetaproteobacteria bacterium CG2_30_46_52]
MIFSINNEAEMTQFAQDLASKAQAGQCFALQGDLGAGKSFLARAMMRALGVTDEALPSPTFAIIQEYEAANDLKIAHMDWYRLEGQHDIEALGIYEYFDKPWLTFIEWTERAPQVLPKNTTVIRISLDDTDQDKRKVEINP